MGGREGLSAVCLAMVFSIGCGSSSSSTNTGKVRFLQASPNVPLVNVLVDGKSVSGNLGYARNTGYISLKSGSRRVEFVPASGGSPILDQTIAVGSNSNQTLVATGSATSLTGIVLADGGTTATTGDGYVRVVNVSSHLGAADVYVVAAGASIVGTKPVASSLGFDQSTRYQLVVAGNLDVFLTTPGTTNVALSTGALSLTASTNQTVFAFDDAAGGATYELLTDQ